jgi:hypothetical protein
VDIRRRRFSESQANPAIRGISDPLLLPNVVSLRYDCLASLSSYDEQFSIGACADSDEVIEGRTTNAGLLRSVCVLLVHRALLNLREGTHSRVYRKKGSDVGTTSR